MIRIVVKWIEGTGLSQIYHKMNFAIFDPNIDGQDCFKSIKFSTASELFRVRKFLISKGLPGIHGRF